MSDLKTGRTGATTIELYRGVSEDRTRPGIEVGRNVPDGGYSITDETMNQRPTGKSKTMHQRFAPLAYEECLIHILDYIDCSCQVSEGISDQEKQKLRQFDAHPDRLSLPAYQRILGKMVERKLTGNPIRKAARPLFMNELREFLERYEHLLLQVTVGHASPRQVRWTLCTRFFAPWAALRIAFHLRHSRTQPSEDSNLWFLPLMSHGKIGSCFMRILDHQVRRADETEDAFAHRLCGKQKAKDRNDVAINLGRDLRRYRAGDAPPSGAKITQILRGCPQIPTFHAKIVLTAAVDRILRGATDEFGADETLRIVKFFTLTFHHFRRLLQRLDTELPKADEEAWLYLQSQTFTGNTPFEAERFYPLMEPFLARLAQIISAELESAGRRDNLPRIPTQASDFKRGHFAKLQYQPLPISVERAMQNGDFAAAVVASQSVYPQSSSDPLEAARLARFFSKIGLGAFDTSVAGRGLIPPEFETAMILSEAFRLFRFAHAKSRGVPKTLIGVKLLRFLLQPQRPKLQNERPLARKLCRVADKFYRESNRHGSALFLRGCLLWLEGNKRHSLHTFRKAADCGRASCGEDWIWLLRYAPVLAEELSRTYDLKYFKKIADREGVTYKQCSSTHNPVDAGMEATHGHEQL